MAALVGMSDEIKGRRFEIGSNGITIGRIDDNSIIVNNDTVSSHHCRLTLENRVYTLKDLGSTNGTRVNGREIEEAVIKPNDLVQVGSVEFVFEAEADEVDASQAVTVSATPIPQIKEETGPVQTPESFASISPFGAPKKAKGPWFLVITLVGIIALLAVIYVFYSLVTAH